MQLGSATFDSYLAHALAGIKCGYSIDCTKLHGLPKLHNVFKDEMSLIFIRQWLFIQIDLNSDGKSLEASVVPLGIFGCTRLDRMEMPMPTLRGGLDARMLQDFLNRTNLPFIYKAVEGPC